jgi:nucleoside-diphosphate-sugar epimerase
VKVAITGGTGLVGRFITEALLAAGDEVTVLGRHAPAHGAFSAEVAFRPFDLAAPAVRLDDVAALVHAGFAHVPGRYRGGEGDDPSGFVARNLEGTRRLFGQAATQGVGRILFLSSRAVYGPRPAGTVLTEEMSLAPDTLYGEVKRDAEAALAALDVPGASLRATGVYGPGGPGQVQKWHTLFRDFAAGAEIAPRAGTELHGADLAAAVRLLLTAPAPALAQGVFNVSDILLDRRDLLSEWAAITGRAARLPERADPGTVNVMATERLRALGWRPRGWPGLRAALRELV